MSDHSPEALARAREQLDRLFVENRWLGPVPEWAIRERATVIELRRENDKLLEEWHTALAELATERQRLEESEADRRVQYCRADAAERLLATERQRAEAAEAAGRDQHDELQAVEERLEAVEKRAEAAEADNKALGDHLYVIAEKLGVGSATIPVAVDILKNAMKRCSDALQVSEAKRKALREALVKYGSHRSGCSVSMRGTEDEGCTCGFYRLTCDDDLSADGKDTPPEETSMRGVRDDSEHYT